jgi:hypothetical protein
MGTPIAGVGPVTLTPDVVGDETFGPEAVESVNVLVVDSGVLAVVGSETGPDGDGDSVSGDGELVNEEIATLSGLEPLATGSNDSEPDVGGDRSLLGVVGGVGSPPLWARSRLPRS